MGNFADQENGFVHMKSISTTPKEIIAESSIVFDRNTIRNKQMLYKNTSQNKVKHV